MKKLRRYLFGLMFACWMAAGALPLFRPMMNPPILYCEENPCKDTRETN